MASLPIDTIWDNARQTALEDCEYLELNPVHLLVHLCQHAAYQHYFSNGIKAICDIDVIVQFYANVLNWQEFLSIIDAINAAKGVLLALWISRQHLKTPLPPIIEEAISAQSFPERIIEDALLSMSGAKEFPDRPSEGIANTIRWWLGKGRKFLGETQAVPSNTGRSSFFASTQNSASRLAYVIQNNMAALIKMQKNTPLDDSAQSQKRIRNYLGLN